MSDAKRILEIVFSGTDDLSPQIAKITKAFDQGHGSMLAFAAPIAGVTEKLLALEAAVVAAGVALGVYAVTEAIKFQDATVELDKVLSDTDRTVQSFGESAIALSNKYGEAAVDVQQSFAAFSAAGFAATEVEGLTESMLKLARVSELDVAEGTEAALRILAGFGAEASTLPRTLDLVNESTNQYGTNVANLTEALARAAPIAKQGNFTIEETIGVLTPIIEVFKSAEMSGSAFVTVIQRLTSDTKDVTRALKDLGVDQKDSNDKMRSARDILFDVGKAYKTLEPSQKAVTTQMLAGTEQAAKFAVVFDNIDRVAQVVKDSLAGVGTSVDKELKKRMEATSAVLDIFKTRMHNAAIIAGGPFLDAVKRLGESGGTLGLVLQDLAKSEGFKTFAAAVSAQMDRAGVAIEKFAKALPAALEKVDLKAFNEQLKLLGLSFEGLFDGIDLTTPEGLATALQKIVDVGTKFLTFNQGLIEALKPVIQVFIDLSTWVSKLDPEMAALFGKVGGYATAFTLLSPAILGAIGALAGFGKLIGTGSAIVTALGTTGAAIGTLTVGPLSIGALAAAFGYAGYQIGTEINGLIDKLTQATTRFDSVGEAMYVLVNGAEPALMTSTEALAANMAALAVQQGKVTEATAAGGVAWQVAKGEVDGIKDTYNAVSEASMALTALLKGQETAVAQLPPLWATLNKELEAAIALERLTAENSGPLTEKMFLAGSAVMKLKNGVELAKDGFIEINGVWTQTTGAAAGLAKTVETVGEKAEKAAEKAAKLALESQKLELEWAKLESHNRELVFKATVDLQLEKVKAEAAQFEAVMKSIDTAIESTGETLGGLAKLFVGTQNFFDKSDIYRLMQKEEERRAKAFEQQGELIKAQLRYLQVSTDRLEKGDALITINAEGVEPELRAVLFKIIELSHIEASGVAGPLLLGLPTI